MISLLKLKMFMLMTLALFAYYLMSLIGVLEQAVLFFIFCIVIMKVYQKKGILHPFSWMPLFFLMYSISYPLYRLYFSDFSSDYIYQIIPLNFVGFIAFVIGCLLLEKNKTTQDANFLSQDKALRVIGWALIIFCNGLNLFILKSGVSTKREYLTLVQSNGIEPLFTAYFLLALVGALVLKNKINKHSKLKKDNFLIMTFATFFISYGLTGERDLMFRFLLLLFFILFAYYFKYKAWKLIIGLVGFAFILPATQQLKSFFVANTIQSVELQEGAFLNNEFASSGKNILYLLERGVTGYGWEIFINDILRVFSFIGTNSLSATAWFNEVLRNDYGDGGTSGWGFSMVGEGYIAFGILGIVLLFVVLGLITALLFNRIHNRFFFCLYLLYIPVFIYVLRADLSNFLSLNFKVNTFLLLVLFGLMRLMSNKANTDNQRSAEL